MGDEAPTTKQMTRDLLRYLSQYAPEAISAIGNTVPGTVEDQYLAEKAYAPGYEDLYRNNQLASSATEADVVEGPGGRLVTAADKYQKELDPEFYASRATISDALDKFLGGRDPYRLGETELAEINRGLARQGPVSQSNLNTVRNAMTFGQAGEERWKSFGDALTKAASVLPGLKSGISGFDVARARTFDTGARDAVNNALNTNFGFASSALGNTGAASSAALAKRKDVWDKLLMSSQIFSNVASGAKGISGIGAI